MKITTYLTSIKRKGSEDVQRNESHLIDIIGCNCDAYLGFRIREKGTDVKVRSEITIVSEFWDADSSCYKRTKRVPSDQLQMMNGLIKSIISTLTEEFCPEIATPSWVKSVIARCKQPQSPKEETTNPTLTDRINEYLAQHTMSKSTGNFYSPIIKKLHRYEAYKQEIEGIENFHLYIETITAEDYHDFVEYVTNEHVLYKEHPDFYEQFNLGRFTPRPVTQGSESHILSRLRAVHHWCMKMGITKNASCNDFEIPTPAYGSPIYIDLEERNRIFEADLRGKCATIQLCRDLFVFQCMIGCRVGDLFSFTWDNIHDDVLQYVPQKTRKRLDKAVEVPLNDKAKEILSRYHCEDGRLFPRMTVSTYLCAYDQSIKKLFKICGITRMVTVRNPITGADEQRPINEVASSHMARRTFIGNLYKKVRDPQLIGALTGHVNGSRSFARYRDIDDEIKQDLVNLIN